MASSQPTSEGEHSQATLDRSTTDAPDREDGAERPDDVRPTTILLWEAAGTWHATQRGVDAVGRGPSAPLAAAQYCREIAAAVDGDAQDDGANLDDGARTDDDAGSDDVASPDEDARTGDDANPEGEQRSRRSSERSAREDGTSERGAASASAARIDGAVTGPACRCADPAPER